MPRVELELPERFQFVTEIPLRITDINYGGHLGNDALLSLLHEARVQFLRQYGFTEMNVDGRSIIHDGCGTCLQVRGFLRRRRTD